MQAATQQVDLGLESGPITVRELTVAEVRNWLKVSGSETARSPDMLSDYLFQDFSFDDIAVFTDLTVAELDALRPSQIACVVDAIKGMNHCFLSMLARLREARARVSTPNAAT